MDSCTPSNFSSLVNYTNACQYVTNYNGCALSSGFINYFQWQYCSFDNRWLPAIFMFIWFLYLLIGVAAAADGFLAPCLVIVSKTMRMSQNLAGVTLLAFGNGAAEVFTSLSAIVSVKNPNVGLALGGILGAGIMVNTITAGIIIIIAPFEVMHRPIIKDLCFYLIGLLWTMFIFIRKQIELWSSLIFLIIYTIYILVTVISRLLYVRKQKLKRVNIEITVSPPNDSNETQDIEGNERKVSTNSSILSDFKFTLNSIKSNLRFSKQSNASVNLNKSSNGYDNPNYISDIQITVTPAIDETKSVKDISRTSSISDFFPFNLRYLNDNHSKKSSIINSSITNRNNYNSFNNNKSNHENSENLSVNHLNVPRISHQGKSSIDNIDKDSSNKFSNYINNSFKRFTNQSQSRKMSERSSIDSYGKCDFSKKRHSITRKTSIMRSTSHRSIGSFADIIIENEKENEVLEKISEKNVFQANHFRSYSMTIISETPPITKTRFWSQSEDTKSKSDVNITNEKEYRTNSFSENDIKSELYTDDEIEEPIFPGTWKHLLLTIIPLDLDEWKEQSILSKIFSSIQIPFVFVFTLTIPVVDEKALMKGWCKILNCIHCILAPIIWIIMANVFLIKFGDSNFILIYLFLIIGVIVMIAVAFTSVVDKPPIYHPAFAFIGLITAVLWIYELSNEIVNVLSVFGVVFSISEVILGLSILAIANSISDLVSDIALARKNYPRIGYTASIGSPLFGLLIGIGLPFSIKTISGSVKIPLTSTSIVLIFTILLITSLNLICLPLMKFQPKKFYGILLICIFVVYFVLIVLFAADVIKVPV